MAYSHICAAAGYYQCPELAAPQLSFEIAALTQFAPVIVLQELELLIITKKLNYQILPR